MPLKLSNEVQRQLEAINLESLALKLEALGVRGVQDLALVDDADLVRWGLSTIERRRFFGHVRIILGDSGTDVLTPPSALTVAPVPGRDKAAGARARRPESTASSVGPARLDELVGRGSAEYQVPRLAERLLASTGPIDISELALRISRTAPALAQGYAPDEWPQFIEACVRDYKRLQVEDGVLQGDRAIVSISSTVLFAASEEVVSDTVCWARIVTCLATPAQVSVVTCLCRASREVADGPEVWSKLLSRWYPKATLLNPDWVAQTDLEKRLEEALENDYALAALTKRLDPDTALDIGDLMRALPQQTTPKALVKFMSGHPEHFRQSPDGKKFCVSRSPDDLRNCKDWRTVNPFQMPPLPKKMLDSDGDSSSSTRRGSGAPPAPSPYGRPKELKVQQAQNAPSTTSTAVETPETKQEVCQQLDPKVAFRLYHTGLLSQRSDQSKRGKLEAWEYYTESNSKCTMAAGDLLDLAESRVRAIRSNDPAVVHELVCQTVEGMVFKVPFGFWHRRVRVLTMGLSASQLRIGREQRKKLERKLLEFMEWVKKERGFGYYQCDMCKSRWKSGFSYEEITQQCLQCGNWQRPYRIQDLESAQEREAREKGGPEGVPEEGRGPLPGKGAPNRHGGALTMHMVPAVMFETPILEHSRDGRGQKRAWPGPPSQQPWQRPRFEGGDNSGEAWTPHVPRHVPPLRPPREVPAPAAPASSASPPAASTPASSSSSGPRYTPGGGGFFARTGAPAGSAGGTAPALTDAGSAGSPESAAPSARYTPGGGGFFSQRSSATGVGASEGQRPRVDTAAAARIVQHNTERPAPAASAPAALPLASGTSADTKGVDAGSRYQVGGGGFFASRQASTQSAPTPASKETDEDGVFAKARDAANSLLAELGAFLPPDIPPLMTAPSGDPAGATKRGGVLKHNKEPEAKAVSDTPPKKSAAETADEAALAASLGLSIEEAQALGLLGSAQAGGETLKTKTTAAPAPEAADRPGKSYKPGGGGFFAQRQGGSSSSSSNSTSVSTPGASQAGSSSALRSTDGTSSASSSSARAATASAPPAAADSRGAVTTESSASAGQSAVSYKPGGGGFFANRRSSEVATAAVPAVATGSIAPSTATGSAATSTSSSAPAPAASQAVPSSGDVDMADTGKSAEAGSETSKTTTAAAPAPEAADRPAKGYKPGGGGFFAQRQSGSSSSSSNSTSVATPGASEGGGLSALRSTGSTSSASSSSVPAATASAPPAAADSRGALATEASVSAGQSAIGYKPGGGGFFANRRSSGNSSSSPGNSAAPPPVEARATDEAEQAQEDARRKAEEAARLKAQEETARLKAEQESRVKAEEDARLKVEEDARLKAEEESKRQAEEEAKRKVAEDARLKAEELARLKAEEEAKRKAEEDARLKAEEDARLKAEEDARLQAKPASPAAVGAAATAPTTATAGSPAAQPTAVTPSSPPALPADKLLALQTLGLTLEEAVKMGIVPASFAEAPTAPTATSVSQAATADVPAAATATAAPTTATGSAAASTSSSALAPAENQAAPSSGDVDMAGASESAEERAAKRRREDELAQEDIVRQDEIRRREAAAKYAAARRAQSTEAAPDSSSSPAAASTGAAAPSAPSTTSKSSSADADMVVDMEGEALSVDYTLIAGGSDEALVEAVNAVVVFTGVGESAGSTRVIAAQASDVAFLLSDDVFWPLLRRLAAETLALEASPEDLEAAWVAAPASSEAAAQHAELRGYCLPGGAVTASADACWRRALLTEAATELMLLRLRVGHGYDLPALAGPVVTDNTKWEERPAESLEGLASKVQGATGEGLAQKIIGDLERTASIETLAGSTAGKPLVERLTAVSSSIVEQKSRWDALVDSTKNGPALLGKWTLLQEMRVREAAAALRQEYGVRRRILLRRLDVTVEALRVGEKMTLPVTQRKFSDILSRMWAGWRRSAAEAPPLSEWSALAAARGLLTRAVSARVSGPGARVSSSVKKVTIGHVPDRGGVPDGYIKDAGSQGGSTSSSAPAPKAAAQGQRPRLARTLRGSNAAGDAAGSSTTGQPGVAGEAASSQGTGAGSAADRGPASVGVKPRDKKGDGKGGTQVGARSSNKELKHQHHAQMKKEREEGRTNTYYAELGNLRFGNPGE